MNDKKDQKVVSITNGQPVDHGTVQVNPAVIEALNRALQIAWAGEMDQVVILGVGDANLTSDIMVAGQTNNPEMLFSCISVVSDAYKEQFLKPKMFGYEYVGDEE